MRIIVFIFVFLFSAINVFAKNVPDEVINPYIPKNFFDEGKVKHSRLIVDKNIILHEYSVKFNENTPDMLMFVVEVGGKYFIAGGDFFIKDKNGINALTMKKRMDADRKYQQLQYEKYKNMANSYDKDNLFKIGNGKNNTLIIASLECHACKELIQKIIGDKFYEKYDQTFYFVFFIRDEQNAKKLYCSENKTETLLKIINGENVDVNNNCDVSKYMSYNGELISKFNITSVPVIINDKCINVGWTPDTLNSCF